MLKIAEYNKITGKKIELSELEDILNYLETTSLEPHDDYVSEFSYKDQKTLWKYIKDLRLENQELKQVIRKIKETLNDEVKFNYVQEKVDAYGVRTVQKTIKSFVLKEKIEEILKEVE